MEPGNPGMERLKQKSRVKSISIINYSDANGRVHLKSDHFLAVFSNIVLALKDLPSRMVRNILARIVQLASQFSKPKI